MTLATQTNVIVYTGNGAAVTFAFNFLVLDETDLVVMKQDVTTGEILQTYTSAYYTVTGVGDAAGGSITLTETLTSDYKVVIARIVDYTQELDIYNQGGFFPEVAEQALDKIVMQVQQLAEKVGRGMVVPYGEEGLAIPAEDDRVGKFAAWDANGDLIATDGLGSDSDLRSDLAAASGADLVGTTKASATVTLRGVGDKLLENRSFSDFVQGRTASLWHEYLADEMEAAGAAGYSVFGNDGDFSMEGTLELRDNVNVRATRNCRILKSFDGTSPLLTTSNATGLDYLGTADENLTANNWSWDGGYFAPFEPNPGGTPVVGTGKMLQLYGFHWKFTNAILRDWGNSGGVPSQGVLFGGGSFQFLNIDARSTQVSIGTGCFRCIWVEPYYPPVIANLLGESGDDIFQFVPIMDPTSAFFGKDIYNAAYHNCRGHSHRARLMVAIVGNTIEIVPSDSSIVDCGFFNVHGSGTKRAIVIENDVGSANSIIERLTFRDCTIDGAQLDGSNSDIIRIIAEHGATTSSAGNINDITFDNVVVTDPANDRGISMQGSTNINIKNSYIEGKQTGLYVDPALYNEDDGTTVVALPSTVYVEHTVFKGTDGTSHPIVVGNGTANLASTLKIGPGVTLRGVGTASRGINVVTTAGVVKGPSYDLIAYEASGATTTALFHIAAGATLDLRDYQAGTVDTIPSSANAGTCFAQRKVGSGKATIDFDGIATSGTVTVTGAAVGDVAEIWASGDLTGVHHWGVVTAADTVTVYQQTATNLASMTFYATVYRRYVN